MSVKKPKNKPVKKNKNKRPTKPNPPQDRGYGSYHDESMRSSDYDTRRNKK